MMARVSGMRSDTSDPSPGRPPPVPRRLLVALLAFALTGVGLVAAHPSELADLPPSIDRVLLSEEPVVPEAPGAGPSEAAPTEPGSAVD